MKNYIQFFCGEYAFLLSTDAIVEIVHHPFDELIATCEDRNGTLFYSWHGQSIPVVNLIRRFGLEGDRSTHQLVLDGFQKGSDSRVLVVVGEVINIVDVEDHQFQSAQPITGEFSKLVDATLVLKDQNWLRIRKEYFY